MTYSKRLICLFVVSCQIASTLSVSIFIPQKSPPPPPIDTPIIVPEPTETIVTETPTQPEAPPQSAPVVADEQPVSTLVPEPGNPQLPRFQFDGVVLPFEAVEGYPTEMQGIWTADPRTYNYSNPQDSRKVTQETLQCELLFVTNLGVSLYDYSPASECSNLGVLNPLEFLAQLEGADIAYGTDFTVYYALLSLSCDGDQAGTLVEVSSEGNYQCVKFKRIENLLYMTYGYIYPYEEEVQCPSSWDVDVTEDIYADSQIVYQTFETGIYSPEFATCIG